MIIAIFGMPGTGKTTLIRRSVWRDCVVGHSRCLLYDPTGDLYAPKGKEHEGLAAWAAESEHGDVVQRFDSCAMAVQWLDAHEYGIACIAPPRAMFDQGRDGFRGHLNVRNLRRGWVYACDETELIWPLSDRHSVGLFITARNEGVRILASGKRPQAVSMDLRSNAQYIAAFSTDQKHAIGALADCRLDDEDWKAARRLPVGGYLLCSPGSAQLTRHDSMRDPIPWATHQPS